MNKSSIIILFLLTSLSYSQIDTVDVSSINYNSIAEIDTISIYDEYYKKGYQAASENYSSSTSTNQFPIKYAKGLNVLQWGAFKDGYGDRVFEIDAIKKERKKRFLTCGLIGCGVVALVEFLLVLPWMFYSG